ncbi:hypothetical protein TNCV_4319231 [Trichonephila clavipes]|nr:hypothetical protein TNCV_4319231 [Trichonephila clavipes]
MEATGYTLIPPTPSGRQDGEGVSSGGSPSRVFYHKNVGGCTPTLVYSRRKIPEGLGPVSEEGIQEVLDCTRVPTGVCLDAEWNRQTGNNLFQEDTVFCVTSMLRYKGTQGAQRTSAKILMKNICWYSRSTVQWGLMSKETY